jgi:hypothetical protein
LPKIGILELQIAGSANWNLSLAESAVRDYSLRFVISEPVPRYHFFLDLSNRSG